MKTKVYSIYDKAAFIYNRPFHAVNVGVALRSFRDVYEDKRSDIAKHPEDFCLYEVGEYCDQTGDFFNLETNQKVLEAIEFAKEESSVPDNIPA
jgi:hypothetical protein